MDCIRQRLHVVKSFAIFSSIPFGEALMKITRTAEIFVGQSDGIAFIYKHFMGSWNGTFHAWM
jgi:hypothetical protein